jgi:hypothetical protein
LRGVEVAVVLVEVLGCIDAAGCDPSAHVVEGGVEAEVERTVPHGRELVKSAQPFGPCHRHIARLTQIGVGGRSPVESGGDEPFHGSVGADV